MLPALVTPIDLQHSCTFCNTNSQFFVHFVFLGALCNRISDTESTKDHNDHDEYTTTNPHGFRF
jgi:hypothetical protein